MQTLSAVGAQLIRDARDQILAHPEAFDMSYWECGTTACIGGWMCRLAKIPYDRVGFDDHRALSAMCGFEPRRISTGNHALFELLYEWPTDADEDAPAAAQRINAFLLKHGYPSEPFTADLSEPLESRSTETTTAPVADSAEILSVDNR